MMNDEAPLGYRGYLQYIAGRLTNFYNGDDHAFGVLPES